MKTLMNHFQYIVGFGSSDCKCKSHLFFLKSEQRVEPRIVKALTSLGYPSKIVDISKILFLKKAADFHLLNIERAL